MAPEILSRTIGSARADPDRFNVAIFSCKSPIPERCKTPIFTSKKNPV